ncbi:MAG: ATP-binding protein [Candidatus Dormiibacterota bacterium]
MSRPAGGTQQLLDAALSIDPSGASNFLRNILQASTEYSIIGQDLEGTIELWNEGARRLYGYEPQEVIGHAKSSILHTDEDIAGGLPARTIATALEAGKFEGKVIRRRKDGHTFTARMVMTPRRDTDGAPIGFLIISSDITEEILLIQKLKDTNAELLAANHHTTAFLATMSHELRTPLNSILGFSELLIDSSDEKLPVRTRLRFLEQIHESGKHLLGLINDILDISKVEAGQMELRLERVSVADVISQVAGIVEPLAAQKGIHLDFEASRTGTILADPGKLKQMILNLISNAIKFTPKGGTATITAARVGERLEIVVSDNGIGISEGDLPRMFKEFQQLDSGVNRAQEGTGLGLALTRSLALLHGGDVRVASRFGKGSRFTIDLPVEARLTKPVQSVPDGPVGRPVDDGSRPLVLIVEDDSASSELLAWQIGRAGFRTRIARTGAEALAMARSEKPVAITLDIMLPDMDGWEILKRLKSDDSTRRIPAIVVSVVDNADLGAALGSLDYFVKPLEVKELVKRLSKLNLKVEKQTKVEA